MVSLGLIGYPLGHSFSARYFNDKFAREGIEGEYCLYPIPSLNLFPNFLDKHNNLDGLNVTIPYKEKILPYLNEICREAEEIGAVNVIKITKTPDNQRLLKGFNTDWVGFTRSLVPMLHENVTSALVLGTGGASKAVAYALRKLKIDVTFVTRNKKDIIPGYLTYKELDAEIISRNLLIVNTTPLGMFPLTEAAPDIPYHDLTPQHICFDLIYNPEITKFMNLSHRYGAKVKNGLEMLYFQADEAWKIFGLK